MSPAKATPVGCLCGARDRFQDGFRHLASPFRAPPTVYRLDVVDFAARRSSFEGTMLRAPLTLTLQPCPR
jgi:hypothetical protein